jgi:hypothetical protein
MGVASMFSGKNKAKPTSTAPVTSINNQEESKPVIEAAEAKAISSERKGGFRNKLANMVKRKDTKAEADLTVKYADNEGMLSSLLKGAMGLVSTIGSFFGGGAITKLIGGLAGGVGKMLGITKGAGLLKNALSVAKTPFRLVGAVSSPLAKIATAGRIGTVLNGARAAMTIGGLATGGLGGVVGMAGSALLTALSSHVVLGALVVGGVAYGSYRAYKYMNRNNVDAFQKLRMFQYGLVDNESDRQHFSQILELETYIEEEGISITPSGEVQFESSKLDSEKILKIFEIDPKDTELVGRFDEWMKERFKPFFLTSMTALRTVNKKISLQDAYSKLKTAEKINYLSKATYESGPYSVSISPFKDKDALNTDSNSAINLSKNITDELVAEKAKDSKKDKGTVERDKLAPIAETTKINKDTLEAKRRLEEMKTRDKDSAPNKPEKKEGGDDGQAPSMDTQTAISNKSINKLNVAAGPISDGSNADAHLTYGRGVNINDLNPEVLTLLRGMAQEYGELKKKPLTIESGKRSTAQQTALYNKYGPGRAAKPGKSLHEIGLAIDIDPSQANELEEMGLMKKYGFTRPVNKEDWHAEPAGIQGSIDAARKNYETASNLVLASVGRGGGGLGSTGKDMGVTRDTQYAIKTAEAAGNSVVPKDDYKDTNSNIRLAVDNSKKSEFTTTTASASSKMPAPKDDYKDTNSNIRLAVDNSKKDTVDKKDNVTAAIDKAAVDSNTDKETLKTFASLESSNNPNAKSSSSSASGLMQFTNATWKDSVSRHGNKYKLDPNVSPTDPYASSVMAAEYIKTNMNAARKFKDNPTIVDAYLGHLLGTGGLRKFLSASPEALGCNVFPTEARSNIAIFYNKTKPRTIAEIYQFLTDKVNKASRQDVTTEAKPNIPPVNEVASSVTVSDKQTASSGVIINKPDGISQTPEPTRDPVPQEKPRESVLRRPEPLATPVADISQGQQLGHENITNGLNTVNNTIAETLNVQGQMLDVLKSILKNVSPEALTAFRDSLQSKETSKGNQPTPTAPPGVRQLPNTGVDLKRKTA